VRSKTLLDLARSGLLRPETLPEHAWNQLCTGNRIAARAGSAPPVRAKKVRQEAIRKYGLGNTGFWIVPRCCTLHRAMHRFTLRAKVLLEITIRKRCSKSPLEITV